MRELVDRGTSPEALRSMDDEQFYQAWLKGRTIID